MLHLTIVQYYISYLKVAKRVDLKSSDPGGKLSCNYVWWWVITRLGVIMSQYIQVLNHDIVHLKIMCQLYLSTKVFPRLNI